MATYLIEMIDAQKQMIASLEVDFWAGNRDKSNRQAIAMTGTLAAYLSYQDEASHDAVYLALGDEGLDWANEMKEYFDKDKDALTCEYLHMGKKKKAVFSLNRELAADLSGSAPVMADAEKGYELAWRLN